MSNEPTSTKRRNSTPRLTFYCPEILQWDLKKASEELGLTVSELLRVIVEDYLDSKFENNEIRSKSFTTDTKELIKTFGERVLIYAHRDLKRIQSAIISQKLDKGFEELGWGKSSGISESNPLINKLVGEEFEAAQTEAYLEKNDQIAKLDEKIKEYEQIKKRLAKEITEMHISSATSKPNK